MKKQDIFLYHIEIPVFKHKISLVFTKYGTLHAVKELDLLQDYANKFCNRNVDDAIKELEATNAIVLKLNQQICLILPFDVTPGVIAHEIFHVVVMILEHRGLNLVSESEEAYAHLIDWLTNEVYKYHNTMKNTKKSN
jgi:predicted metal-dependent peptidase